MNNYKYFYGYDVIGGELIVNEKQAEVVRKKVGRVLVGRDGKVKILFA